MHGRTPSTIAPVLVGVLVCAMLTCAVWTASAHAQDEVIRFEGRIAWIAGASMVVTQTDGPSVDVDLQRIPQSELRMMAPHDYVVVTGVMLRPGRRVLAISIERVSAWYPQAP